MSRRARLLQAEARACLHIWRLTQFRQERKRLRDEALRLAQEAEREVQRSVGEALDLQRPSFRQAGRPRGLRLPWRGTGSLMVL